MNKKILALTLGDGYLSSRGTLKIMHCANQKEYIVYKASLVGKHITLFSNNGYPAYYFEKGTFNNIDNG